MLTRYFREYLRYRMLSQRSSADTIDHYDRTFSSYLHFLQEQGLRDVCKSFTGDSVFQWSMKELERGLSPRTVNTCLSHLSGFAEWALGMHDRWGKPLITGNPVKTFKRPKWQRKPQGFLFPEELRALMELRKLPAHSIAIDLLIDSNLRVSELVWANVGDVERTEGKTYLRLQVKGGAERLVPLSPAGGQALVSWLAQRGEVKPTDPLLLNLKGKRWCRRTLSLLTRRLGKRAGITRLLVSAHKLRHTMNVVGRRGGLDTYMRSQLLNHTTTRTLEQYDHALPDELYEARLAQRKGLEEYLGGHS